MLRLPSPLFHLPVSPALFPEDPKTFDVPPPSLSPSPTDRPTEPPGPTSQKDRRSPASSSFVLLPSPGQPSSKKEEEKVAVTRHKPGEILCQRDENLGPKVVEPGPHHFSGHMCSLKSVGGGGSPPPPPPLSPSIIFPTKKKLRAEKMEEEFRKNFSSTF